MVDGLAQSAWRRFYSDHMAIRAENLSALESATGFYLATKDLKGIAMVNRHRWSNLLGKDCKLYVDVSGNEHKVAGDVIDSSARMLLCAELVRFRLGTSDSSSLVVWLDSFIKGVPRKGGDPVFNLLYSSLVSALEDPFYGHIRVSQCAPEFASFLDRAILFLESDLPYEWPYNPGCMSAVKRLLSLGIFLSKDRRTDDRIRDAIWPFYRSEDYRYAKKRAAEYKSRSLP